MPSVFWIGIQESFVTPKLVAVSVLAVVSGGLLVGGGRVRPSTGRWRFFDWCVVAFALLVLLSYLRSIDQGQSFWGERYQRQGVFATVLYVAFYALSRSVIDTADRLQVAARAAAVGGIPVALYALAQRTGLDPLWDDIPGGRVFSTIGQTNSLGAYLVTVIPISLGAALAARRASLAYWMAFALQITALVLTESRGGYLGMLAGIAVLAALVARQYRRSWSEVAAVSTAAALVLVIVAFNVPGLSERSEQAWTRARSADEWTTGSIRNHLDLWTVAGHVIADNPLLGTGPDTFPLVFGDYRDDVLPEASATRLRVYRVESPHNIVLAHAAGSGIPAAALLLVVFVGPVIALATRADRRPRPLDGAVPAGVGAGVVGGLVASMFITADFGTTWILWTMAGSLVAATSPQPTRASTSEGNATSVVDATDHSTSV